jgi:gamma-glutamyltranspeptidase/glutathione hydrolase
VRAALAAKGDKIVLTNAYSDVMGGGQAVEYNSATGVKFAASDPRKDGEAVPQPAPIGH